MNSLNLSATRNTVVRASSGLLPITAKSGERHKTTLIGGVLAILAGSTHGPARPGDPAAVPEPRHQLQFGSSSSVIGIGLYGLHPAGSAESRKTIVDPGPLRAIVEEDMNLGRSVDRLSHVGQNDVDLLRVLGRLAE